MITPNGILAHIRIFLLFLFAFFCICTPAFCFNEEDTKIVIDHVLKAYGGKDNISKITTVSAQGRIDDFLRHSSGGYSRIMQRPNKLRIDLMPEKGGEVRVLNGDKGLQGSGDKLHKSSPLSLSSMKYQYSYLELPMSLADGSADATYRGIKELYGRPTQILLITCEGSPTLTVYLDIKTHLIRRIEANFNMGSMGSSLLGTEYEDFRNVDGVLFPFKLNNFAGGNNISVLSLKRITTNQPLPKGVFQKD